MLTRYRLLRTIRMMAREQPNCSRVAAKLMSCIFLIFFASSGEIIDTRGGLVCAGAGGGAA
jgi:hypothetical protein